MILLQGVGVSPGIVFGKLCCCAQRATVVHEGPAQSSELEKQRFQNSVQIAKTQLEQLAHDTKDKLGESNAQIFNIHKMMLDDIYFQQSVHRHIEQHHLSAENAVNQATQEFAVLFSEIEDEYLRARSADIFDAANRVTDVLRGKHEQLGSLCQSRIFVGDDFSPSETAQFDQRRVLALAMRNGHVSSHATIFARTIGIPAVIGLKDALKEEYDGFDAILDGTSGQLVLDPTEEVRAQFLQKQLQQDIKSEELRRFFGKPTRTKNGRTVELIANIGSVADVGTALAHDAQGIGLFRSEFLYLSRPNLPTEEEQFQVYREVLEKMDGREVTIRTLDIGADKQLPNLQLLKEENPALGTRGIRLCLQHPTLFKTQLRALYRASFYGKLSVLIPMITSTNEILQTKKIIAQVCNELQQAGIPFDKAVPLGIMIETPAAAIISDQLAEHADFFSIGSNDLTQYTLAIDRQSPDFDAMHSPPQRAILRLIEQICHNAHSAGIQVGICGELGADYSLTPFFISLGMHKFSVAPTSILPLRKRIGECEG